MLEITALLGFGLVLFAVNGIIAYSLRRRMIEWRAVVGVAAVSAPVPILFLVASVCWVGSIPDLFSPNDEAAMLAFSLAMLFGPIILFSVASAFVLVRYYRGVSFIGK